MTTAQPDRLKTADETSGEASRSQLDALMDVQRRRERERERESFSLVMRVGKTHLSWFFPKAGRRRPGSWWSRRKVSLGRNVEARWRNNPCHPRHALLSDTNDMMGVTRMTKDTNIKETLYIPERMEMSLESGIGDLLCFV